MHFLRFDEEIPLDEGLEDFSAYRKVLLESPSSGDDQIVCKADRAISVVLQGLIQCVLEMPTTLRSALGEGSEAF